jgi:hypothetical protein
MYSGTHSIYQLLIAKGFGEKLNRARLHCLHRHLDIAVSGDEDNRNMNPSLNHLSLEIETAQVRQPDVENYTRRNIR